MKRTLITLALAAATALAVWSGLWFGARLWLKSNLDAGRNDLATAGTEVTCAGERFGGWPLDLTVACPDGLTIRFADGSHLVSAGASGHVSALHPRRLDLSLETPANLATADGRQLRLDFASLDAGLGLGFSGIERWSLAATDLTLSGNAPAGVLTLTVTAGELHVEPTRDHPEDADIAASVDGLSIAAGNAVLAPLPIRLTAAATLTAVEPMLAAPDPLPAWQAAGGELRLHRLEADLGGAVLTLSGTASLGVDGLVNGMGEAVGRNLGALSAAATAGGKALSPELAGLAMAFLFMGTAGDDGSRAFALTAKDGVLAANGHEVGRLPPLF